MQDLWFIKKNDAFWLIWSEFHNIFDVQKFQNAISEHAPGRNTCVAFWLMRIGQQQANRQCPIERHRGLTDPL